MSPDEFTEKRFFDLSRQAYEKNYVVFSDFLNLSELALLEQCRIRLPGRYVLFGGYEDCERQMAAFLPDAFSMSEKEMCSTDFFSIRLLRFQPKNARFAEKLTHRDVLGALMGLQIGREKIGDIVLKNDEVYIFAVEEISNFLLEELRQIRKTFVYGENTQDFEGVRPELAEMSVSVSSNRLDAVVGGMLRQSRGKSQELIKSGYIYINNKQILDLTKSLLPGDVISARGFGKFIFNKMEGETKKGRMKIRFQKYL